LRDRFLQETRTAAKFSHPNIVPVYSVEEADGLIAYAMGFVEGETLAERVARMGPLPAREIVRMLQDVGYALAYAHGRNVVHRDIKPDNVMIERATGRALVMDFGISRTMTHVAPAAALTRVGEVVGTPEYMSPEQASGDVVDGRSDLYALGLTAHFAATGRAAVTGETTQKILVKQLTERVALIASVRPDLPEALGAAIDLCVEKDPAARFQTAEALVEAIDAAQLAEPEIPVPVRLFAGEVSMLSTIAIGIVLYSWFFIREWDVTLIDQLLPVSGLLAVLFMRTLTTLSEAQRIAKAGFSADDITTGFQRVVAERASRRDELRADQETRLRRRRTLTAAFVMLVTSLVMSGVALSMRTKLPNGNHTSPTSAVVLIFSGTILLGMSLVLLFRSPFRMPLGERLFRFLWLGPFGRAFVRFGTRSLKHEGRAAVSQPKVRAGAVPAPALALTRGPAVPPLAQQPDRLTDLERRVTALEQSARIRSPQ
jgi:serine/threonine-protein kinase